MNKYIDTFFRKKGVQYDEESLSYVTPYIQSEKVINWMVAIHGLKYTAIGQVIDLTGCVGGNSLEFALKFNHVVTYEIREDYSNMLQHNADIYNVDIDIINSSSEDFIDNNDVVKPGTAVFFDPPWGGKDYKSKNINDLYIGKYGVLDVINSCKKKGVEICVAKLPYNFNMNLFKPYKQYYTYQYNKVKYVAII